MRLNMLLAMIVISSISLSAMEERGLVVAPGKSKEATKQLHRYISDAPFNLEFQGIRLYNKLEECFQMGADPNAKYGYDTLLRSSTSYDEATEQGMLWSSLIPLAIQYGAEIDKKSGIVAQTNALHIAAYRFFGCNYEKAYILLQCGADVNCKDGDGRTPLNRRKYCSSNERFSKLLLIYGADPFIKDNDGYDAVTDNCIGVQSDTKRRSTCLDLHAQAQALLAFKEVIAKSGERYMRNADGKLIGKRDENGAVQLKTTYMESLPLEIIENIFVQAGFPYPHRRKIEVINVQVEEQSN